jgi:hypothetical protein
MSRSIKDTIVLIDGLPDRIKELSFEQADELLDIINNYFAHGDVQVPKDHHQDQPRVEPPKPQDPPVTPKQPEPKQPEQPKVPEQPVAPKEDPKSNVSTGDDGFPVQKDRFKDEAELRATTLATIDATTAYLKRVDRKDYYLADYGEDQNLHIYLSPKDKSNRHMLEVHPDRRTFAFYAVDKKVNKEYGYKVLMQDDGTLLFVMTVNPYRADPKAAERSEEVVKYTIKDPIFIAEAYAHIEALVKQGYNGILRQA